MTSVEDSKISIMQSFDADESIGKGSDNGEEDEFDGRNERGREKKL